MRIDVAAMIVAVCLSAVGVAGAEPAFKPGEQAGCFAFDTGVVRGTLRADGKSQGMPTVVDVKTGTELAYGGGNPGILSYYRLFSKERRWGDPKASDTFRAWPQEAKCLDDGSVRIQWAAKADHPVAVTATYRWVAPGTLDLETTVTPQIDMPEFEIFLSSYFNHDFKNFVYVHAPRQGKPYFLQPVGSDLVFGTYLAFPRDLKAARMIYDGRWEQGHNPVQWSVTRFLAAPLGMMVDEKTGVTFVQMARPEECFAMEMPYNLTPPDGVAGHHSMYFSLFGGDVKAGQSAKARFRMVVGRGIDPRRAVELYEAFVKETQP
ncbi:MAG: hypothetical protein JXQ73_26710 [Phycisphaerae bacterium]|nr:hypothetical protein [Phycisphaerae bacterium]